MDNAQFRLRGVLLASALIAIGLLGWRHDTAVTLLDEQNARIQDLNARLDLTQGDRDELIDVINRLPPAPPFLAGTDARDSSVVQMELPADGVFYVVRVTCPFCGANDSALHQIAAADIPIFVIGLDSDIPTLGEWVNYHGISGRAFVDVSGSFVSRLPTERVPRTVVVRSGLIRVLETGVLDSAATQMVLDSTGGS